MKVQTTNNTFKVDKQGKNYFWLLMLIGLILITYFSINMLINFINGVDLAGVGISVVQKEALVDNNGEIVTPAEVIVFHGISGWVESFSPWLALNGYLLALGSIFFGLGYVMTRRREEKLAVSLFKMRLFAGYLFLIALMMLILGIDRVFFIPHGPKPTVLLWTNWYILEFLAHILWAAVLGVLFVFFFKVRQVGSNDERE
ncbi:MAG: hypothetical protein A2Y75_05470 [Candidatus Solincola sediminis]|uniref:Uncharacterized protein n=1 Tax=Candidatus Solincola sediminis TaxID=1797199 RepID=A0A1F2WFJ4_9ACTN|nr:MAG: hypothetical protein A2Y75_05470 [Candidatus Solincola sediminis]